MDEYIESRQNQRIKNLVKLRDRKHRDRQERFLIEGLRELSHAVSAGLAFDELYYCPDFFPGNEHSVFIDQLRERKCVPLVRITKSVFEKITYREGPDGLLAVAPQFPLSITDLALPENPLLLVLEGIEKPGNLGAILRSADAAGVDAVVLADCVLDLFNPNAIRASQGLVFAMPVAVCESSKLIPWLGEQGIEAFATTPDADALYWDKHYTGPAAIVLGSESRGLSDVWLEQARGRIRIPMGGKADSLNVAAAAALCLFEARRQRESQPPA